MMTEMEIGRFEQGLAILEGQGWAGHRTQRLVGDYAMPNASEKVVRIILSYTDYVVRTVWQAW
jgi:UDP-N-acetyl-L-fucosamine synthase